jgi:DNA-binding beta-propeller fold protein YncE
MRHCVLACICLSLLACGPGSREPLRLPPLEYGIAEPWPDRTVFPPPGQGRIVVTNSLEDTVSLLPLEGVGTPGWGELARVPVGLNPVELEGPHHAAFSPQGDFYYVGLSLYVPGGGSGPHGAHGTGTADGYCLKIDSRHNQRVAQVRVDRNPGDLLATADGRTLLQTHFDLLRITEVARRGGTERDMDARLALIDSETMSRKAMVPVCPAPHAVRLSPDERRAYIACLSDEVAVVQLDAPGYPVTRVKVAPQAGTALSPRHEPYALTVSPTTGAVWVSSPRSRQVQYLDPQTLRMDPRRTVYLDEGRPRGAPYFGTFSADGRTLYLPYQQEEGLAVIDAESAQVVRDIALAPSGCLRAHQVVLTPDERHALVVCEGDYRTPGTLHAVELATSTVVNTVRIGLYPDSVGILRQSP